MSDYTEEQMQQQPDYYNAPLPPPPPGVNPTSGQYVNVPVNRGGDYAGDPYTQQWMSFTPPPNPYHPNAPTPRALQDVWDAGNTAMLNPGNDSVNATYGQALKTLFNNIRMIPGGNPQYGYFPGGTGAVSTESGLVPQYWLDQQYPNRKNRPDQVEGRMLQIASDQNIPFPRLADIQKKAGGTGLPDFGRGFSYGGQASAEEQALTQRMMSGQQINMGRLIQLRGARMERNQLSPIQQIAQRYYAPFIMNLPSAFLGPGYGAAWGALTGGMMDRFKHPEQLLAGAAGGALGGWGGQALGEASGLGSTATGALGGAGASLGRSVGQNAVTGNWDAANMGINMGIGGFQGAIGGAFKPEGTMPPGVQGPPTPPGPLNFLGGPAGTLFGNMAGQAAGQTVRSFLPQPQPPPRPVPRPTVIPVSAAERLRQEQQRRLNPYNR